MEEGETGRLMGILDSRSALIRVWI